MENKTELYKNPIQITSQFTMCGNCFRADTYRGCDFGCKYCFANNRQGNFAVTNQISAVNLIEKWMNEASEYEAPNDFNCVWSKSISASANNSIKNGQGKVATERLFLYCR